MLLHEFQLHHMQTAVLTDYIIRGEKILQRKQLLQIIFCI
jgi:hypothetical protein